MTQKNIEPMKISTDDHKFEFTTSQMPLNGIFSPLGFRHRAYLNYFSLYTAHFNRIPNIIEEIDIDCKKAHSWFIKNKGNTIQDSHYSKNHNRGSKQAELDDIFHIIDPDLIVNFHTLNNKVRFMFRQTPVSEVKQLVDEIKKHKKRKVNKSEVSLLVNASSGIEVNSFKVPKINVIIEDNYNEDFNSVHQIIINRLQKNNDKGLVLLHGKPGTGKTSYIRYLISIVNKKIIFLPPNMASIVTNPDLIRILAENSNSILVIEDAENLICSRESNGMSPVSGLLNISDGILSDCLNIQIICSFNTDISKVDSALLRKGRLIAKYEFRELEIHKASVLSKKLGFNYEYLQPTALTDIYNQNEKEFIQQEKNRIGFHSENLN